MAGLAAKMFARNAGKLGKLANRVDGLSAGLGAAGVAAASGIPAPPGMGAAVGAPVTERIYIGSIHKKIYFPNAKNDEPPAPEPVPVPEPQWTPDTIQSTFTGIAGATAVAGAGYVTVTKAPGVLATWGPTVIFMICIFALLGLAVYFAFFRKGAGDAGAGAGDAGAGDAGAGDAGAGAGEGAGAGDAGAGDTGAGAGDEDEDDS